MLATTTLCSLATRLKRNRSRKFAGPDRGDRGYRIRVTVRRTATLGCHTPHDSDSDGVTCAGAALRQLQVEPGHTVRWVRSTPPRGESSHSWQRPQSVLRYTAAGREEREGKPFLPVQDQQPLQPWACAALERCQSGTIARRTIAHAAQGDPSSNGRS